MLKALFVMQDPTLPSSRIRVMDLLPHLAAHGVNARAVAYPKLASDKFRLFRTLPGYDVVVIQKKLLNRVDFFMIREQARRLAFDFDDAIYMRHESDINPYSATRKSRFERTVRNVDLVIAGSAYLAGLSAKYNDNSVVVPTTVPMNHATPFPAEERTKTVIGWIGTEINLPHIELLADVFNSLSSKLDFDVHIICSRPPRLPGIRMRFFPWSIASYPALIRGFDMGVMPLPASRHAEGKCCYKALQYMAAGVVPIVSDVGCNRLVVEDEVSGLVLANIPDFSMALLDLARDDKKRERMGQAAKTRVVEHYSTEVGARKLAMALIALVEGETR